MHYTRELYVAFDGRLEKKKKKRKKKGIGNEEEEDDEDEVIVLPQRGAFLTNK
jgi:hypothetical protein